MYDCPFDNTTCPYYQFIGHGLWGCDYSSDGGCFLYGTTNETQDSTECADEED